MDSKMPYGLTVEEIPDYLIKLYDRLLENRYRYYILDAAILDDWIYDLIEKEYNELVAKFGGKPMDMVGFDLNDPLAIAAKQRVDSDTDYHSLCEKEMQAVWDRLGRPRKYVDKKEKEDEHKTS